MSNKSTTLHPFMQTRQSESVRRPSPVEPRLRRPKTERQCRAASKSAPDVLSVKDLTYAVESHLTDFASSTFSPRSTQKKKEFLRCFVWFATEYDHKNCDVDTMRAYFAYLNTTPQLPESRWGNGRPAKPLRPSTIDTHYRVLNAFFNWLVREERIISSPMKKVTKPKVPQDQVQPFTDEQMLALLKAAQSSRYPKRDFAIISLFYDTGIRASELAGLQMSDIDWQQGSLSVLGKGRKRRVVYADPQVMKALFIHLQQDGCSVEDLSGQDFVFVSQRGTDAGEPMNRNTLYKLIRRLSKEAGITNVRCSPHTMRHSYAVSSLRGGMNVFTLQQSLGHTSLRMTSRYVALTDADLKRVHEKTSPLANLKKRARGSR